MIFPSSFLLQDNVFVTKGHMTLDNDDKKWLSDRCGAAVRFDEPMARCTSLGVGGPAGALVCPTRIDLLVELVDYCRHRQITYHVIGGGTNLLVGDKGVEGIVVSLKSLPKKISVHERENGDAGLLAATAGVRTHSLCRFAVKRGLGGLGFAVGIPGTVGGAIAMNAGTRGHSMADVVERIEVICPDGLRQTVFRGRLSFSYRKLSFDCPQPVSKGAAIILSARFSLRRSDPERLAAAAKRALNARRQTQPPEWGSAGCFFKNPGGEKSAGELIEQAGLKGKSIGNARVSEKHANFLINAGGATAEDFIALIDQVRETVATAFGIELEPEVKIIGT